MPARRARLLAAAVLLAAVSLACGGTEEAEPNPFPVGQVPVESLVEDTDSYEGNTVTVDAAVVEVLAAYAVEIGDDDVASPFLVVGAPLTFPEDLAVGDEIVITGDVVEFDVEDLAEAVAVDVDDDLLADHGGEYMLIATRITAA